jgi:putative membrane protein
MRVTRYATLFFVMSAAALSAHGQGGVLAPDPRVFSAWDQATIAGLSVLAVLYGIGARRLAERRTDSPRIERVAFVGGWLALLVAVLPRFDSAVIERFSAHMAQHELMMLVGAPLVVAGRPLATCTWALSRPWRRLIVAPLQRGLAARGMRMLTAPVVAWALHGAVLWIWHLPALYNLAIESEPVHAVQHAMFVGTSLLFWSGLVYGRYGRAGYGAAVFFVFTTAVHTGLLGALIAVSKMPIYSVYANLPGLSRDAALADQEVAGLVMWIPAGLVLTLVGIALFAAWLGESERRLRLTGYDLRSRARP